MAIEEMAEVPAPGPLMAAAAGAMLLPRRPRPAAAPAVELLVRGVTVDKSHLARYSRVCGFPLSGVLPPTYPHVLAFGVAMRLMTRPDFPFPLPGLVHIANHIDQRRPVGADEALDVSVKAERFRPHERGYAIDVVTAATVDGAEVWVERSSYLRRSASSGRPEGRRTQDASEPPKPTAIWRVGRDVGTAYARVSGDRNPIHTSRVGAKLFGFPRPIAHGMWTLARSLAALTGRLPEAYKVDASFKLPILLPAAVAFTVTRDPSDGWAFQVLDARTGRPHLIGAVTSETTSLTGRNP
ncbi:MAG TPA: MaoC/PaaZ C-terminal domain-containing protein [Micromonosporaceae bacterium]|nr:MaoC/PaaZ C-terminal domain-containing protein [Micromonosporaceae bacterium]